MASLLANTPITSSSSSSRLSPQIPPDPHHHHKLPKGSLKLHPHTKHFKPIKAIPDPSSTATATSPKSSNDEQLQTILSKEYKWGFFEDIDSFTIPKGLSEDTIRLISSRKNEPEWMLEFRLKAYEKFLNMSEPKWSDNRYPPIDFQDMCYYSEPKKKPTLDSLEEADPELLRYFEKLGVPLTDQHRLANLTGKDSYVDCDHAWEGAGEGWGDLLFNFGGDKGVSRVDQEVFVENCACGG